MSNEYYSYFQICNAKSMSSILVILASYSCLESLWVTSEGGLVPLFHITHYMFHITLQMKVTNESQSYVVFVDWQPLVILTIIESVIMISILVIIENIIIMATEPKQ